MNLSRHPSALAAVLSTALLSVGVVGFVSYADASPAPGTRVTQPGRATTTPCPTTSTTPTVTTSTTSTATSTTTGTTTGSASASGTATTSSGGGGGLPSLPIPLPTGTSSSASATVTPTTATPSPTATPTCTTLTPTPTVTPTATPTTEDTAPTANAHVKPTVTFSGTVVSLSAMGSSDNETAPGRLKYSWNFDNGGSTTDSTKMNTTVTFAAKKIYQVTLTVTDPQGLFDTLTVPVTVYKRVDCQSNGVSREGPWRVVSSTSAFGGKYCDNQGTGPNGDPDSISTTFQGTVFRIDYGIAHGGGHATIYIDGVKKKDFSFGGKMTMPKFGKTIILRNIPAGRHQLRIEIPKGSAYLDTFAY